MGTNYYIRGHRGDNDLCVHIGKRSSAGPYCFNCARTLCESGENRVHCSSSSWYDACPQCGLAYQKEAASGNIRMCTSFSWVMTAADFMGIPDILMEIACKTCGQIFPYPDHVIENEYGDIYTKGGFQELVDACPIQFYDSVGEFFS